MTIDPNFSLAKLKSRDAEAAAWYERLLRSRNLRDTSAPYHLEHDAGTGDVKALARSVNQQLNSLLAVFRVTGDRALLDKVYAVMQQARGTLRDTNGDGYRNWRYLNTKTDSPHLVGTDKYVMEEMIAHAMVAQAAYAFHANRHVSSKYAEAAEFWQGYLEGHFEAKWRERTGRKGYPLIDKELMHPYVNFTRYHHYMYKLTGKESYRQETKRRIGVIRRAMLDDNGAYVWTHTVNEYLKSRGSRMRWKYQPTGYVGETMGVLADLAYEGLLDDAFMRKVTKALTRNMLDGKGRGRYDILAPDVGGGRAGTYYVPFLKGRMHVGASGYARTYHGLFNGRPFALLIPWDATGELRRTVAPHHERGGTFVHGTAGMVLGRLW